MTVSVKGLQGCGLGRIDASVGQMDGDPAVGRRYACPVPQSRASALAVIDTTWIERRIYVVHGQKVMLDADLATLYGVPTGRLNEQVRRNVARFPGDFLFRLTAEEVRDLAPSRSQNAILNAPAGRGRNVKYPPAAFTEHGVTMLSAVLRSPRAVTMSIAVVRAFVRLRQLVSGHGELAHRVDDLEQRSTYHEGQLALLFDTVHELLSPEPAPDDRPAIGFHPDRLPPSGT